MKKVKILLSCLLLIAISVSFCSCGVFGSKPKGEYIYKFNQQTISTLFFAKDKVNITVNDEEIGYFNYSYDSKTQIITVTGEDYSAEMVYDKKEDTINASIAEEGYTNVYKKYE